MTESSVPVVLDTNILLPAPLRDIFLRLAKRDVIRVYWSTETLDELRRNLVRFRGMTAERVNRLLGVLETQFPDACVKDYDKHIPFLRNDPKDRHVLAAAVDIDAKFVVTNNIKDFENTPDGITAITPSDFLLTFMKLNPSLMLDTLREQAADLKSPRISLKQLLQILGKSAGPFAQAVLRYLADEEE